MRIVSGSCWSFGLLAAGAFVFDFLAAETLVFDFLAGGAFAFDFAAVVLRAILTSLSKPWFWQGTPRLGTGITGTWLRQDSPVNSLRHADNFYGEEGMTR
jgi:hypothetical protein